MSSTDMTVPARAALAVRVGKGESFRVLDPEGGQVGDLFAFAAENPEEYLSAAHTRAHIDRLFPVPGQQFFTDRRRPLLTLVEDTSPGRHDMLIPACDPARYQVLGAAAGHASCADNLFAAAAEVGLQPPHVPQPVNLFMDIAVEPDGTLTWRTAPTDPGDGVTFRAERDCIIVLSACPQDMVGINKGIPSPLRLQTAALPG